VEGRQWWKQLLQICSALHWCPRKALLPSSAPVSILPFFSQKKRYSPSCREKEGLYWSAWKWLCRMCTKYRNKSSNVYRDKKWGLRKTATNDKGYTTPYIRKVSAVIPQRRFMSLMSLASVSQVTWLFGWGSRVSETVDYCFASPTTPPENPGHPASFSITLCVSIFCNGYLQYMILIYGLALVGYTYIYCKVQNTIDWNWTIYNVQMTQTAQHGGRDPNTHHKPKSYIT